MTARAHTDAIITLIGETVRLYDGMAPDGASPPYAVLYADNGNATRTALAAVSDRRDVSFQVTSVGLDGAGARSVAERVRAAVLDERPVVAGRTSSPVRQEVAEPLRVDRDVTPHLLYVVDVYAYSTVPATS